MDYVLQNTGNTQDDLKTLLKYYKDHLYLAENYYKDEGKAEKARKMTNFAKRPCKIWNKDMRAPLATNTARV